MDARLDDHFGFCARGLARQRQTVAGEIAHAVEDFRGHVIVAQDYGLTFALEPIDLGDQGRMNRPLDLGDDLGDARVKRGCGLGDRVRIGKLDTHALLLMPPAIIMLSSSIYLGQKTRPSRAGYDVYATPEHKEVKAGLIGDFARLPRIPG